MPMDMEYLSGVTKSMFRGERRKNHFLLLFSTLGFCAQALAVGFSFGFGIFRGSVDFSLFLTNVKSLLLFRTQNWFCGGLAWGSALIILLCVIDLIKTIIDKRASAYAVKDFSHIVFNFLTAVAGLGFGFWSFCADPNTNLYIFISIAAIGFALLSTIVSFSTRNVTEASSYEEAKKRYQKSQG